MTMTWNEIKKEYPDEWVILKDTEFDVKGLVPVKAEVIEHAKSRKAFSELLKDIAVKEATILYTGDISNGRSLLCKTK